MDELDAALRVLQEYEVREIQKRGFHFQRCDNYSPLNDLQFLDSNRDLRDSSADPLDIDWNIGGQLEVARQVSAFVDELRDIPESQTGGRLHYYGTMVSGAMPTRWFNTGLSGIASQDNTSK